MRHTRRILEMVDVCGGIVGRIVVASIGVACRCTVVSTGIVAVAVVHGI